MKTHQDTAGKRLIEQRKQLGLTQAEFASMLGVTTVTAGAYEREERFMPMDKLVALGENGFDIAYIITGKRATVAHHFKDNPLKNNNLNNESIEKWATVAHFSPRNGVNIDLDDYAWIPLYNVEVSAGNGRFTDVENVLTYFSMTKYSLRKRGLTDFNQLGFVIVHGDSMFDTLHPNDSIMINFAKTKPDGGIFVLRVGDSLHVKRLIAEKDCIRVISDNKRYPEWTLDANDDFTIIGKYEWHGRYAH